MSNEISAEEFEYRTRTVIQGNQTLASRLTDLLDESGVTVESKVKVIDPVNHPPHYAAIPATCDECDKPIECIQIVRHMNFNRGNAVKYIWRSGVKDKNREIEDLQKAVFYLQDEIRRLENE